MKAIVVTDEAAGTAGMRFVERPDPDAARQLEGASYGDVVVAVHASGRRTSVFVGERPTVRPACR